MAMRPYCVCPMLIFSVRIYCFVYYDMEYVSVKKTGCD